MDYVWYYNTGVINPDDPSDDRDYGGIDGRQLGNYLRFINHAKKKNCGAKQVLYKVK
jgi:hypothetical protein